MVKRNNLKNHVSKYGEVGRYTYHAGYNVNAEVDADAVAEASLRSLELGDLLIIRDNQVVVKVTNLLGSFLEVEPVDTELRKVVNYHAAGAGKVGRYVYGRIIINKAHLDSLQ